MVWGAHKVDSDRAVLNLKGDTVSEEPAVNRF